MIIFGLPHLHYNVSKVVVVVVVVVMDNFISSQDNAF